MSLGRSTYVYMFVGVWLISNKLLVSSSPLKPNLNDKTEMQSADMNSMSTKKFDPLVNLYQSLQRETFYRTATVRKRDSQEDSIAQINMKKDTYLKKFDTEHPPNDYPQRKFGTWNDRAVSKNDEVPFDNKNDKNAIMDIEDSDFTNEIYDTISSKTKQHNDFSEKMDKEVTVDQGRLLMPNPIQEESTNDTVVGSIELDKDPDFEEAGTERKQPVDKRQEINCDLSKVTLNMLVEYFRYRTLCGTRTAQIRYGLGK